MKQGIWQEFDGYNDIVREIEATRKYRENIIPDKYLTKPFIERLHPAKMDLRITEVIEESSTTKTFRLVSDDHYLPPFLAGQYITLYLTVGNIRTGRPYSISSSPDQTGYYDITVRRVENGLVSNHLLDEVSAGDVIETSGPSGNFYHNPLVHEKTMVCIAGGSGITPFMSMIREIAESGLDRTVFLFYGNKNQEDVIFHDELVRLSHTHANITYTPVIEEPLDDYDGKCGFITGAVVSDISGDHPGKTYFLCGPRGLYDFCLPELEKLGVPQRKVRREMYGPPLGITDYPGWPAKIKADDRFTVSVKGKKSFQAKAGESLLTALENNGILVPSLCRSGECSMCRVKILSGSVYQPAGTMVRKSDRKHGYVHSCVSFPLEDLEVLV